MAPPISISCLSHPQHFHAPVMAITFFLVLILLPRANAVSFSFSSFSPNMDTIFFQDDAFLADGKLQITKNTRDYNLTNSAGRATYKQPVRLYDANTRRLTDFTTHFTFVMRGEDNLTKGDGLFFFLAPNESQIPANSFGGYLALFSPDTAQNTTKENQIVAVEFDSFKNEQWDPSSDHVGININSIVSAVNISWKSSINNGKTANAWKSYNSTTKNLSVFLTCVENPVFNGNYSLWYVVDLRDLLPEWVRLGFSAATGDWVETHNVLSWEFTSTLEVHESKSNKALLAAGLAMGLYAFVLGASFFAYRRIRAGCKKKDQHFNASIDAEFERGTGPKRFTYQELSRATNDFDIAGKLGEGGFGGVYKGLLTQSNMEVAVTRVSRGSQQGKKEYVSEVRIISRLRHRNLVQLIGWCHEQGEFLLVYEYLPNGRLDSHLFGRKATLTWNVKHKIALGLASALLYLHEEWEQCVVLRDIKSSNIMLDSNFNAKLGDFGLARLVDHELGSQTTILAGIMGCLAPECVTTGKAKKESDVCSFGVVALEITWQEAS